MCHAYMFIRYAGRQRTRKCTFCVYEEILKKKWPNGPFNNTLMYRI